MKKKGGGETEIPILTLIHEGKSISACLSVSPVAHVAVVEEAVVDGRPVGEVASVLLLHRQPQAVRRGVPEHRLEHTTIAQEKNYACVHPRKEQAAD